MTAETGSGSPYNLGELRKMQRAIREVGGMSFAEAMIVTRAHVDILNAWYALSTRKYEVGGTPFDHDMLKATRAAIGQRSKVEREAFRQALDIARELLPGDSDKEIRF